MLHGGQRQGRHIGIRVGGNAMTDFLVFGSIAGTNAAEGK